MVAVASATPSRDQYGSGTTLPKGAVGGARGWPKAPRDLALELGHAVGSVEEEGMVVRVDLAHVGAERVEAGAQGVRLAILGAEEQRPEGLAALHPRQARSDRSMGGDRRRDPALALAGIAFEERQLAQRQVRPPEEGDRLRRHLGHPA